MLKLWDQFWFSTSERYHYGLFRILLVGGLFIVAWDDWQFDGLWGVAAAPPEFTSPTFLVQVLHLPMPIPASWITPLIWILRLLILTSLLGFMTRPSLIGLALINLYLNAVVNSFGFIDHATSLPSLVLLVMAFAPGVAVLSLDSLIYRLRHSDSRKGVNLFAGPLPVWPAHLILVLMALGYFSSGYSKLVMGSWAWMDGKTLTTYLTEPQPANYFVAQQVPDDNAQWRDDVGLESFIYSTGQPTGIGRLMAGIAPVMLLLSTVTVLWETTFPITIFIPRLLPIYLLMGIGFHLSIMLTLKLVSFYSYLVCYLLFVDWRWVAAFLKDVRQVTLARLQT